MEAPDVAWHVVSAGPAVGACGLRTKLPLLVVQECQVTVLGQANWGRSCP